MGRLAQEPGVAVFQGLRIRLTLWYCGVLGVALLLFGVLLYCGAQYFLLQPPENEALDHTQDHVRTWLSFGPSAACPLLNSVNQSPPSPNGGYIMSEAIICYDQNGLLPSNENTTGQEFSTAFLDNSLAEKALQTGQTQYDIVDAGGTLGQTYRCAQVVNLSGREFGVVMVGETVQVQENVLASLLMLLLSIGGLALLGAGFGGLFLANRALAPARLAWDNQQRFIADASHELRTPLTLLRADAEVLLRGRKHLDAEDAALLEDIVAEANHMGNLANNMLTLARLDNRPSHREHEVVNLSEIVRAAARRAQALADQKNISIQLETHPATVVIGDSVLLEQAVLALLDNAIKYNRQGGQIMLRTEVKEQHALLEVSDTGIGIAAEHLSRLGERFYRVDKARSREAGGTGLGLSIVQSIAATHAGTLTLKSVAEQGTTVTFTLPLVRGTLTHHTRNEEIHTASGAGTMNT
jgi:signal transduction histidine kinase